MGSYAKMYRYDTFGKLLEIKLYSYDSAQLFYYYRYTFSLVYTKIFYFFLDFVTEYLVIGFNLFFGLGSKYFYIIM